MSFSLEGTLVEGREVNSGDFSYPLCEGDQEGSGKDKEDENGMINFKRILCPIDYSECSARALRYAAGMALKDSSRLYLMHVVDKRVFDYGGPVYEAAPAPDAETIARLEEKLKESIPREVRGDIQVETLVTMGLPVEEILKAAMDKEVDVIVMGTHGRTGIAHTIMGSVAENVVRRAPCPVLTVRQS
jgi:universal stress protein A